MIDVVNLSARLVFVGTLVYSIIVLLMRAYVC